MRSYPVPIAGECNRARRCGRDPGEPAIPTGPRVCAVSTRTSRSLTMRLTTLAGQGWFPFSEQHAEQILGRNPELGVQAVQQAASVLALGVRVRRDVVLDQPDGRPRTRRLARPASGGRGPRGPVASFERRRERVRSVRGASDRPTLPRSTRPSSSSRSRDGAFGDGPLYTVTDLATARRLGLTPVKLENQPGGSSLPRPGPSRPAWPPSRRSQTGRSCRSPPPKPRAPIR